MKVHLLAPVRHEQATILGQQRVAEGTNEIGTLPGLLAGRDLGDTVTTVDAMFTQRAIAQQIIDQGGHYLMVVKKNQPQLYEDIGTLLGAAPLPRGEEERQVYNFSYHLRDHQSNASAGDSRELGRSLAQALDNRESLALRPR